MKPGSRWLMMFFSLVALIMVANSAVQAQSKRRKRTTRNSKRSNAFKDRLRKMQERLQADKAELERILRNQERIIQQQNEQLKQTRQAGSVNTSEVSDKLEEFGDRLTALEEDLDNVLGVQDRLIDKINQDRLNWSGAYRMVVNNFHLVDKSIDPLNIQYLDVVLDDFGQPVFDPVTGSLLTVPVPYQKDIDAWYGGAWVHRVRLTVSYDITENLRFYGQLGIFKYLNEFKDSPTDLDMHANRYPRDQALRFERAYIDWFITDWLVLTAGRVASPEGPPAELKENTIRNATWGVQMVEADMETIMLTIHLSRFMERTYLRLFYIPFGVHEDFSLNDDTLLFKEAGIKPMHAWGAMLEMKLPYLGDNLWQFGYVHVNKFRPRPQKIRIPGLEEPITPAEPTGQNLGQYVQLNTMFEAKDIFGTNLDCFAAYTLTILQPTAHRMVYYIPFSLPVKQGDVVISQVEGINKREIGLASYDNESSSTSIGQMFYVGARYTLPISKDYSPRFGFEINHGTKYHIPWASPSELLVNRLATKGWAWEAYYIQQLIPERLFIRFGYIHLLRNYTGLYIGPTYKADQSITNAYVLIDATW